jgi:pimeloyl-ACP methyl ester carboxylesterase
MKTMPALYRLLILTIMTITTADITNAQTAGHYAQVNGIKMYYEVYGAGQPLVLIHGGGSTLNTTFGRIMPELAKTHQVIAVDLQNHGRTAARDIPETFEQDADDVAELLKQLNISNADIFGFSNGGSTALQIAIRHPKIVRKIVAVSAIYKRAGMPSGFWDFMKNANISAMPQVYKDVYLAIPGNTQAGLQNMHDKDAERMKNFVDWNPEDIKGIQTPTLVVVSDQDVVLPEHAIEMSRLLPHGRLIIMPGSHGAFMGEIMAPNPESKVPVLFVAMLNEFLAGK